jgi:hypothetical protein
VDLGWLSGAAAVALLVVGVTGCTSSSTTSTPLVTATPKPVATPSLSATPTPTPTPVAVRTPPKRHGELARLVFSPKPVPTFRNIIEASSKPNERYAVSAACQATDPTHTVTWDVRVNNRVISSETFLCNGVISSSADIAPAKPATFQVEFKDAPTDLIAAYATVTPNNTTPG